MNIDSVGIGCTHSVWSLSESTASDVRKGITKSRMITGTYMPQSNVYKLSNVTESSICKSCATDRTGKCIRRFGGIYAYCRYFIDRKW